MYFYTPSAQWSAQNPTDHTPSVSVYMMSGVQADTDIDLDGNTIVVTWAEPHTGYMVIT